MASWSEYSWAIESKFLNIAWVFLSEWIYARALVDFLKAFSTLSWSEETSASVVVGACNSLRSGRASLQPAIDSTSLGSSATKASLFLFLVSVRVCYVSWFIVKRPSVVVKAVFFSSICLPRSSSAEVNTDIHQLYSLMTVLKVVLSCWLTWVLDANIVSSWVFLVWRNSLIC